MLDAIVDFFRFWSTITWDRFIGFYWYFFLFDLTRYVICDFLIVLILGNIYNRLNKEKYQIALQKLHQEKPLISVIAPGKNEGKHIPALAKSLREQTYRHTELIVVDDGSTDNTPEICRAALKAGLIQKFFRNNVRGGKASAANLALRFCSGKYVVHLDADSHLSNDAIEKIILPFYMDDRVGAVGGNIEISNIHESLAATLQGIEYAKSIGVGRRVNAFLGILRIISGAFGAFRKDILDRIGGWDVGPGLDGDITFKHRKLGYKIAYAPDAICLTNSPTTFEKLAKQRYRWDRSLVRFRIRKHHDLLLPTANFRFLNFFSAMDNILFNVILNINWWIYYVQVFSEHSHMLQYLLPMNYLLYVISSALQFAIYLAVTRDNGLRKKQFKLFLYIPLMPLYTGLYLRMIRTWAYFMEFFFKKSYEDSWNPWKVSKIAKEKGL